MTWFLGLLRLIPGYGTAMTFLSAFKGPCAILAIVAGLIAGGLSGTAMWKLRGKIDAGKVAEARQELADWKAASAQERIDSADRNAKIMAAARVVHDEQMGAINGLAGDLQRIAAGVRVCTSVSTMRLSPAPAGSPAAVESGKPRPAEQVLLELVTEFARRADTNAADYNSLMKRWEDVAGAK